MPYLRTEWAVQYPNVVSEAYAEPVPYPSALIARERAVLWNEVFGGLVEAKVVQRQISDWGDDE